MSIFAFAIFVKTNSLNKNYYEEEIHLPHLRVCT